MTKNLHTKKHKPRFGALAVAMPLGYWALALLPCLLLRVSTINQLLKTKNQKLITKN